MTFSPNDARRDTYTCNVTETDDGPLYSLTRTKDTNGDLLSEVVAVMDVNGVSYEQHDVTQNEADEYKFQLQDFFSGEKTATCFELKKDDDGVYRIRDANQKIVSSLWGKTIVHVIQPAAEEKTARITCSGLYIAEGIDLSKCDLVEV